MKSKFFVFDTNTLVSAFLFRTSVPTSAYNKAKELGKLIASVDTYDEFWDVFLRPKFEKYVLMEDRLIAIGQLKEILVFHRITEIITDCRDPKDNKFLELAVVAKASCIITGDDDLLVLHPFRRIPILNALDFLNVFQE